MGSVQEFNLFELAAGQIDSGNGDDNWNDRYDTAASLLSQVTFGSPYSLISRSFDLTLSTQVGQQIMSCPQNDQNSFFFIPTMIAVHYPSTLGSAGNTGFTVTAASQGGYKYMAEVLYGNSFGSGQGNSWTASTKDVIYASLHQNVISTPSYPAAASLGSPGTWPVAPVDFVNRDITNLHSDAGKPLAAEVCQSVTDSDLPGGPRSSVFIRAIGSQHLVKQVDLFGLSLSKSVNVGP